MQTPGRLHIDYRVGEPDAALRDAESFDVLLLLEVVEHVDDVQAFVQRGGGPSQTRRAAAGCRPSTARCAASWPPSSAPRCVFRVLPRGTHRWAQFVRPEELRAVRRWPAAWCRVERRGMAYLPAVHRAWWTRSLSVNYIASFGKPTT